jgi:LysR family transcriptional regulator, glycine cleavage system transcriptional activator
VFSRRFLPSLPSLLALEAVDRLGSASAAAAELAVTQGAVSRQLQVLEGQLGVPLLRRDHQRLSLTPAARDYVHDVRKALNMLASGALALRANPGGGALNLAILPAFGMHWLAPRLPRFVAAHPEVTLNLSTQLRPFDFATEPFDAAIHYGRSEWGGTSGLKLMDEEVLAVASPVLVPTPLTTAREVLNLPLLQLDSRTGDWGRWLAHHGAPGLRPPAMLFDQFATMAQGAVHGLGLAILPMFLIGRELDEGRLVPVHGGPVAAEASYHLVWPDDRPMRGPLASFHAWITLEIGVRGT